MRGGIKTVLIPEENVKDLADLPKSVKSALEIVPVSRMDQVLKHALTSQPEPVEWDEAAEEAARAPVRSGDEDGAGAVAH
jgi:ATP-dependent Lon protease